MMSGTVVSTLVFAWNQVQSFLRVPLMRAVKDFNVDDRLAFSSWWDACRQVRQLHAVCHMLALACEHDLRAAFAIKLKGRNRYIEQLNEIARRRRKGHYDWNAWKPISGACHVLGSDENNGNDAQRYMPEIGHQHYDMPRTAGPALPATSHDATAPGQALAVPPAPRIGVRRALDGNLYSYAQFRDWYGEEASYRCWFQAPLDDVSEETAAFVLELFRRGIVLGLDGSLLDDGDLVFVVNPMCNGVWREWNEDDHLTLRKIDYWHGVVGDQAVCQMCRDETNYAADELISACHGFTAQRITHL
ncbi:MAG: hypothetical protein QF749_14550, partial [Verrucomicrobiota bacterium]|nr:hypothetical protein [Verrucomicrobiota bacterium]